MQHVVLVHEDMDRHGSNCGCGNCNVNGKAYGVAIYPVPASSCTEEEFDRIVNQADPLDHVYGPSEDAAMARAEARSREEGWIRVVVQ